MHTTPHPPADPRAAVPPRRSTSDRLAGGVSSAAARYLGVSRNVARGLFVLASFVGGLGVMVYVAAWLFVPDDQDRVLIKGEGGRPAEPFWAALAAFVASLLVTSWFTRDDANWLVALLVGIGVFVLAQRGAGGAVPDGPAAAPGAPGTVAPPPYRPDDPTSVMATPTSATAPEGAADENGTDPAGEAIDSTALHDESWIATDCADWSEDGSAGEPPDPADDSTTVLPTATGVLPVATGVLPSIEGDPAGFPRALPSRRATMTQDRPERAPKPPKPPKPAAFLGPLTVSTAVLVCGFLALLTALGVWELRLSDILITALAIVGAGLLVSTWYGRARGLVLLGLVLVPVVLVSATLDRVDLSGDIGDQRVAPTSADALGMDHRVGMGVLTLDLRDMSTEGVDGPIRSSLSVGAGAARVYVPADWTVDIPVTLGVGEVELREKAVMTYEGEQPPPPEWTEWAESLSAYDVIDVPVDSPQPSGVDGTVSTIRSIGAEGAPVLELEIDVTLGYVEVFRVES